MSPHGFRPLAAEFPLATAVLTLAIAAYSGGSGASTSQDSSAIATNAQRPATVDVAACLTAYVSCHRAAGAAAECLAELPPPAR
jgi:hypothetical protein